MPIDAISIYQQRHLPYSTNEPTGFMAIMRPLRCGIDVIASHSQLPGKSTREVCNDWALAAKFAAACKEDFDRQLAPKTYEQEQQETCGFIRD